MRIGGAELGSANPGGDGGCASVGKEGLNPHVSLAQK